MLDHFETGNAYLELGMEAEARQEFLEVPSDDPAYASAQAELLMFESHLDLVAKNRKAEEGLALIRSRPEIVNSVMVNNTALCLHFAGRTREAYDLTLEFAAILDWAPIDFYGLACYASKIEEFEEAAANLVEGMSQRLSPCYTHMLADPDLWLLFRHAAKGNMKIETALSLANPRFGAAVEVLLNHDPECDGMLLRKIPARFRTQVRKNLETGFYEMPPSAPTALRRDYREWLAGIAARTASLVRRGIERAREVVLDAQFDFAVAAAVRGDFLAARYHVILSIAARPDSFGRFDAALSPRGMAWFFDDIRRAWAEDSSFRRLMAFIHPSGAILWESRMEMLEVCGLLAKTTTFWILCRSIIAQKMDAKHEAKAWQIEVIRRWPEDPAAYHNLLLIYEEEKAWDAASLILANVPQAFHFLSVVEAHRQAVIERRTARLPSYTAFHGQRDLGGVVLLPNGGGTSVAISSDSAQPHPIGPLPHSKNS